mmetsp:Transcript_30108/g.54514  ORF Transcript_30108/g.54514 Transcript_30108/m.54514 type:complete len:884 (+) Transcript_30108:65-2716(+)|eukprot:CAMPEP_0197626470 /NCGR_PEP_ID=MMETSP1338-20131121/5424_1 /TAXON_ID=43686 ORGANISM="Pelagodinium beii, Strain RCC1491" /NCGR_SAMPLE_ID=MMETSP1338 /ASSEMBLY_ACC=CAM_ASM_000754 /LENGTH=883 /DNA_ID=CAMNT_0043197011 /DNA_START=64 /DNA_END=2715 /DNA_ORIENTATION=-
MIDYGPKVGESLWHVLFKRSGSVFPRSFLNVLPSSLLAVALKLLHVNEVFGSGESDYVTGFYFLNDGGPWGAYSSLVVFVLVFRLSAAYSTYWAAYSTTNGFLGDWSGAASSTVAFCRGAAEAGKSEEEIETFLHTVLRLFSMLSACALQELSPRKSHQIWGLLTLNADGIDNNTLETLDGSDMRVDLCYHWIQQLIVDNERKGILHAPKPIIGRVLGELSAGMGKFGDAKKHATNQFNFPYAQTCWWLLISYSVLVPMMMVRWSNWVSGCFIYTFTMLLFTWTLHAITEILESPFDTSNDNCIDVFQLQLSMNKTLLLLLNPRTRATPRLDPRTLVNEQGFQQLQKRDTVHKACLKQEGWKLKEDFSTPDIEIDVEKNSRSCCSCCRGEDTPADIAVSELYCKKRFGIVDDEKTAALPIGIFGDELLIAIPSGCKNMVSSAMLEVEAINGRWIKVLIKKVAISERHKLHKFNNWPTGDYEDFPYEIRDLAKAVFSNGAAIASLGLAQVKVQAEVTAEKRIQEAKLADKADKAGLGIDQIGKLKFKEAFCKALEAECGLTHDAAVKEWQRRASLPAEYERDTDERGNVMIELDVEAFKRTLEAKAKEEQKEQEKIEAALKDLEVALGKGHKELLDTTLRKAEVDTKLSQEELQPFRDVLDAWERIENSLREACEQKQVDILQAAVAAAEDKKLQSESYKSAKQLLQKQLSMEVEEKLEAAKKSGNIAVLEAAIGDSDKGAEASLSAENMQQAKELLNDWLVAEQDLQNACGSNVAQDIKVALALAGSLALQSQYEATARSRLKELESKSALVALAEAESSGNIPLLEAAIVDAERLELEVGDFRQALEALKAAVAEETERQAQLPGSTIGEDKPDDSPSDKEV